MEAIQSFVREGDTVFCHSMVRLARNFDDLRRIRRTCATLCHVNGRELEQIQVLLGHVSVLTTERYLGCKQNPEEPVNDRFGCLFARKSVDLR